MTQWLTRALFVLALLTNLCPLAVNAQGVEDRVAFIIGNGGYPKSLALKNPLNDATAIEKQLTSLGFETKSYKDLKVAEVAGLRQQMESRLKRNSVLFFYYAGHGVQIDGRNYLLPVDATLNDGDKASQESLYLGDVLHAIERMRPKIAVVILDACRDNPFKDQKNSAGAKQGLARVDPPTSTVVFYATRPGGTAQDGDQDNGVFTQALLQEMVKPEQPLEVVFRRVSTSVFKSTKSEQEPWIEGVIREEFVIASSVEKNPVQPAVQISSTPVKLTLENSSRPPTPMPMPIGDVLPDVSKIKNDPQVTAVSNSIPLTLEPVVIEVPKSKPVSWEIALRSLSSVVKNDLQELNTSYSCTNDECIPYKEWTGQLKDAEVLGKMKKSLESIKNSSKLKLCEFDLEKNKCVSDDVKTTVISPLSPISSSYIEGMKISNVKLTNSGGIAFDGAMLQGARFFGVAKGHASCAEQSGKLEFLNDRVDLIIGRTYCLGVVPVPGTAKLQFSVLISDPEKRQFIVKWNWGLVAFMAGGTGSGVAKLTIE